MPKTEQVSLSAENAKDLVGNINQIISEGSENEDRDLNAFFAELKNFTDEEPRQIGIAGTPYDAADSARKPLRRAANSSGREC